MAVRVKCDILICGGGLAGLSLLYRAFKSGIWSTEKIIVIDRSDKSENDRTWSFWKTEKTAFEEMISHRWDDLVFFSNDGKRTNLQSGGYTYNSIRSIDFYQHVLSFLKDYPNISFIQEDVLAITSSREKCTVTTPLDSYESTYLFNSIYQQPELLHGEQFLLQHFKGWRIKTQAVIPKLSEAYLMDFRTGQQHGTTFFYTLPFSNDEIFIEYTLFSKSLLPSGEYDREIKIYLAEVLGIDNYDILEEEFGAIPMTDYQFKRFDGNMVYIGTAGGDTRGSTGYTFSNTQKTIGKILNSLQSDGHPFFKTETIGLKAKLYDSTLLHVLTKRKYPGHQLFSDLFSKAPAHLIFSFLDAETSIFQDFRIMKSLKTIPFLKSFLTSLLNRMKN